MKKVCMIIHNPMVKGGIAAVVNGYHGSQLEKDFDIIYVESYKDGNKIQKIIKALSGYFHFAKVLIINDPDIIHMHTSFGASFIRSIPFIFVASLAKKPIINHIHGADFEEFYINASEKKKNLIRKMYGKCSVLIALSEEWKIRLNQVVSVEKIKIIENYSILCEDALEQRLQRPSNKIVLFLGEIGIRKGCYDFPAVVKKVAEAVPDARFVIGGSGDIDQITALLEEEGVKNKALFPGWVRGESKDLLLRDADVFFLPSYNEGMPMSILDAMGYGLPIVSTKVGGITKLVHNNKNGCLLAPGDIKGFSDCIISLLTNENQRKQYGVESSLIVSKNYSLKKHIELIMNVYQLVCN